MKINSRKNFVALLLTLWLSHPPLAFGGNTYCKIDAVSGSTIIFLIHVFITFLLFSIVIKVINRVKPETKSTQECEIKQEFKKAA